MSVCVLVSKWVSGTIMHLKALLPGKIASALTPSDRVEQVVAGRKTKTKFASAV